MLKKVLLGWSLSFWGTVKAKATLLPSETKVD
jgi:hypothetical protein